jgi:nucleoside-diphosphate-sugar epimerase
MRILLTGATGYLGRHILRRLLDEAHEVTLLVRQASRLPPDAPNSVEVLSADLADPVPQKLLTGRSFDVLVHAAACTDYAATPEHLLRVNRNGAIHAIRAAAHALARRVVYISSLEAAGPLHVSDDEAFENRAPQPATEYGRSKLAGEQAASDLSRMLGLELVVLRPGNIYGEGTTGIAGVVAQAVLTGSEELAREWANHRWQPVHVQDVVQAVLLALTRGDGVFHITDGQTPRVGDLAADVATAADWRGIAVAAEIQPSHATPSTERVHYRYRLDRAWNDLGYRPRFSFRTGLLDLMDQLGLGRPRLAESLAAGVLPTLLLNTPSLALRLNRDMGGGMGFVHDSSDRFPPLDLLSLGTTLKSKGWPVAIVDGGIHALEAPHICHLINREGIRAVVAEVNLPTFEADLLFLRELKRFTSARIIAKTALTEAHFHERLLREGEVDFVLTGECDLTIAEVLLGQDERGTARLKKGVFTAVPEERLTDLSQLPLPERSLLSHASYTYSLLPTGFTTVQSSRGCPYSCGFYCPYPLTQGKSFRARSAQHVFAELKDCAARGLKSILFRDATFTLDKARVHELCELIRDAALDIQWWCETRINCLDDALLANMAAAGCRGINFGIESGDDEVLAKGAKQGVDVTKIKRVLAAVHAHGMHSHLLVVVGLPDETRASLAHTYDLLVQLPARSLGVTGITPFPGTDLWKLAVAKTWLEDLAWEHYGGNHTVMRTDHLSSADIRYAGQMLHDGFKLSKPDGGNEQQRQEHRDHLQRWVEGGLLAFAPN